MKILNCIIRGNSNEDNICEAIIDELEHHFKVENKIIFDTIKNTKRRDDIKYFPLSVLGYHDSKELHYANRSIDADTLEKMQKYKSMAMHMMMRDYHYDMYDRLYLEEVYYRYLKYANDLIEEYDINCCINLVLPHHYGEYILYALCQIKNIPYIILCPQIASEGIAFGFGNSIETIGEDISEQYNRIERDYTYEDVGPYMKKAVERVYSNTIMQANQVAYFQKLNKKQTKDFYRLVRILYDYIIKLPAYYFVRNKTEDNYYKFICHKHLIEARVKVRKIEKKMDHIKDYNRYSVVPNFNEKYIYYALHMTPEASTMPQAGEFKNQLLALEILSEAACELNFKIYVKEHWQQYHRETGFYEKISKMKNVCMIDMNTNSIDLIENSMAVATQTGNVIFESLIKKKPVFVFCKGYLFKGCPNLFEVSSARDLIQKIMLISKDFVISDSDIFKYVRAMEDNMVYCYVDSVEEASKYYDKKVTAEQTVRYLMKYM